MSNAWNGLFHYGDVQNENERLRAQLGDAQGQAAQGADAKRQLEELSSLEGIVQFTQLPSVTSEVISGPLTNFEHTLEIDRGSSKGIKVGMPVVTG